MVRDIRYTPTEVTDWATSLGKEFEKERRNRAIWDQQRTARDKQAEAADPGVTTLKVLESAIEFSGTAGKVVRDTKEKMRREGREKEAAEMTAAGVSEEDYQYYKKNRDNIFKEDNTLEKLLRDKFDPEGTGQADAKIKYLLGLGGRQQIRADSVANMRAVESLSQLYNKKYNSDTGLYDQKVGTSLAEEVAAGTITQAEALAKLKARTFGDTQTGLASSAFVLKDIVNPGFEKFRKTLEGSQTKEANKAAKDATTAFNLDEATLAAWTDNPKIIQEQWASNLAATGGDKVKARELMQATLSTLATKVSPTVLAKVLAYKTPEGEEPFHKGMPNKSFGEQIFANDPSAVNTLLKANRKAYGKYLKENREAEVTFIRENTIAEAGKILDENPNDLVGFKARIDQGRSRLRAMGESTEKLDRMAEWTATPAGIENDLKNIKELELNGKYSEALTYIKKSGNPLLNGLVDRLTKQQVARSGDNYKSKRRSAQTLVAQLVTLNSEQKDIDGRPDVAAVQSDLTRYFDKELTKLIDLGTPADEAIDRASQLTTKYWVDNGGGQKTSQGATGKFVYNDQGGIKIKGRANKGGFDNFVTFKKVENEFNVGVDDLRRFNMELKDVFGTNPDIDTLDDVLTKPNTVLTREDIKLVAMTGKFTPEVLWKARRLGIEPWALFNTQTAALMKSENPLDKDFVKENKIAKMNLDNRIKVGEDIHQYLHDYNSVGSHTLSAVMKKRENLSPNQLQRMAVFKDPTNIEIKGALWPELKGTANEGLLKTRSLFNRDKYNKKRGNEWLGRTDERGTSNYDRILDLNMDIRGDFNDPQNTYS